MKRDRVLLWGSSTIILLIIFAGFVSFNKTISVYTADSISQRFQEIVTTNTKSFNMQIDEQIKKVNTLADYFGTDSELGGEDHIRLLQSAAENNGALRCAIAFPDGSFVTNDNKNTGNVSKDLFFVKGMAGEFYISNPQPAVVDNSKTVILFTAPIKNGDEIKGTLTYSYLCDDLERIFNLSFLDGDGAMMVTDSQGNLLIGSSDTVPHRSNLFDYLRNNGVINNRNDKNDPFNQNHDVFEYMGSENGKIHLITYSKLPYNDWYMFSMVSENSVSKMINYVQMQQGKMIILVFVSSFIYLLFILMYWLKRRMNEDKLTGAMTLKRFKRVAYQMLKKNPGQRYVVIKLDVKNFKLINRIYSFAEGDRVIKNIANSLSMTLGQIESIFARVGIDSFIIIIPFTSQNELDHLRSSFISNFRKLMGADFSTKVDFPTGTYITTAEDSQNPDFSEIFEKVNFAHHAAKQDDNDLIVDYEDTLEYRALFRKEIEDKMEESLEKEEFLLYLQPKINATDESVGGAEALVRWQMDSGQFLNPAEFVPILEKSGFIMKVDMFMFKKAVIFIRGMLDQGEVPFSISVNFSRHHLRNERFVEELCRIADEYQVPHHYLEVELTETVVFENVGLMIGLLEQLHQYGFTLSMDDFGSGYSSLGLLKDLAVDVIKLDRQFFMESKNPERAKIVVANMIRMAKALHIKVVAEGVEDLEHVMLLKELGCDMIQGYYYAKPTHEEQFLAMAEAAAGKC